MNLSEIAVLFGEFFIEMPVHIFNISISASFFALAVMLFRFIFKKSPKWLVVALWALVAIRLICPFSIESAMSLIPSAETLPLEQAFATDHDSAYIVSFDLVKNPHYTEFAGDGAQAALTGFDTLAVVFGVYVWFFGVFAMLLYALISYIKLRRTVRTAIPSEGNVWLCDNVKSPFILGVFRPRIYLPSDMDEQTAELVLKHEKAHLKRKDHLWKPFGFVLLSLHWFNPVLWLSYVLLCRDIELACDEKVIKDMEVADKKAYSEALLSCSVSHRMIAACPVAFGEVGVKKRIRSVLNYKKPAFWLIVIALIVSVVIALCFMTDPKSENGGTLTFNGVDEISEISFKMDEIMSSAFTYTVYNGNSTTDDYFVAKSEDIFCFREVSSFLKELSIGRIVDGAVNPMHEPQTSGVIDISYDEKWTVKIIFHDNFTKMYMSKYKSDGTSVRSKNYYVKNPDEAKNFFNEKPYMQNSLVWEYNLASSAWRHYELVFLLDSKYQINGKVKGKGKISTLTNEDTGAEGISWCPEFLDGPDEYIIEIPVIAEGKEKLFSLILSKVGKKALSTYFTVRADNLVIAIGEEPYKFVLSEPEDPDNLQWYYNPSLIAEGYTQLSFMLPDGYTVASREIQRNGIVDNFDYNAEAAITEFKWSPDYDNIMETGKLDMTVTAVKDRETVDYKFTLTPVSKDEKGGIYFDIEPLNCIITQYKWATYMLDGSAEEQNDTVTFYDLEADGFDTELLSELLMTEKATVESGDKEAVVYKCDNILAFLGGTWEFEEGFYSHPSGAELWDMKEYSIKVDVDRNRTYNVNFNKDCSLMWLTDNKGSYTPTYKLKNPKEVKEFFDKEKFFEESYIWEYNPSANTYSYNYLRLVVEGEYGSYTAACENGTLTKAEIKKDKISGIIQSDLTKETDCTKNDNLVWSPDGAMQDTIHIKLDGNTSDFYIYVNQLGTNYAGNAIYKITADYAKVMKVKQGSNISFNFEQTYDVIWSYNPMAGGTWWYQTKYILPEGYEIKSAEATSGEATIEDRYYNNPDGGKLVCWSPDHFSPGNSILTVVGTKSGKEKEFIIHMDYEGDKNDTGKKKYIISPVNCKIKQDSIAAFLLEEK